ncbi:MAG: hypothetical protein HQK55_15960, partial [Deltaproteobacteria bacterium]|nr:hypothetical protein [Deltaproteobacteria bacterium]
MKLDLLAFLKAAQTAPAVAAGSVETAEKSGPTIDPKSLQIRPSTDNSMFIAVPPDWRVGGGNYALAATSPDEKMGVFSTNDHRPATYNPNQYLLNSLLPFLRCRDAIVKKHEPNHEMMNA